MFEIFKNYIEQDTIDNKLIKSYVGSQVVGRKLGKISKKTLTFIITGSIVISAGSLYWLRGFLKGFIKKA